MQQFLEEGGCWVIGGMFAVGLLAKLVVWFYYGLLGHACKRPEGSKNKLLRQIREDVKVLGEQPERQRKTEHVAEYRLACCRIAGVYLGIWEEISRLAVPMTLLAGCCFCLAGIIPGGQMNTMLTVLLAAGCCGVVLVFFELISGVEEKKKRTRLFLYTYAERCAGGLRLSDKSQADKPSSEKVRSVGRALEEKRRLTEELLRERRQLEARQLAEQRNKERESESLQEAPEPIEQETALIRAEDRPVEQETENVRTKVLFERKQEEIMAQEEAAAAIDPFEQQLQLVLAEFLRES